MNRRLRFGAADPFGESNPRSVPSVLNPLRVLDLQNAYFPEPIPPEYRPPPPPAQPMQVIEPTHGWWRQAGAFGRRFEGRPPDTAGMVIPLTEQLELPGPPAPWWLNFFRFDRVVSDEAISLGNWDFRARVIYGVGGVDNVIETDLIQGVQFAVVCNSLTVQLVTYRPIAFQAYNVEPVNSDHIVAGCVFGKGGAGNGTLPVTWTTEFQLVPFTGLSFVTAVPDFARSVVVHTSQTDPADLAGARLLFASSSGVTIKEVIVADAYDVLTQDKGIAIPGGTNQVFLVVDGPSNEGFTYGLQFFLAL